MRADDKRNQLSIKALSVVPAVAVVAVVLSSYVARAPDIIAARVYGGPPSPDGTVAWRVVVSLRDRGFYEPVPHAPITLRVGDAVIDGITDDEGAWEARMTPSDATPNQTDVIVSDRRSGRRLLASSVALRPASWKSAFRRVEPQLSGRRSGALEVDLFLHRAFLASAFPERALVRVSHDGSPVGAASLNLVGDGVKVDGDRTPRTDAQGQTWITLRPVFPAATLSIEAKDAAGETGRMECVLPVRNGAMWVDPDALIQGTISISSPVGHRQAFVSIFTQNARLFGARVPMRLDRGGSAAELPLPALPNEPAWIMVSPDPPGTGNEPSLLGWPIPRKESVEPCAAAHASTLLLADGMPVALTSARERAHAGRVRGLAILALAAMIESALLWMRARQAKRELEALLASHDDIDEVVTRTLVGGSRFWVRLVIATLLVAVAFGTLAVVISLGGL